MSVELERNWCNKLPITVLFSGFWLSAMVVEEMINETKYKNKKTQKETQKDKRQFLKMKHKKLKLKNHCKVHGKDF